MRNLVFHIDVDEDGSLPGYYALSMDKYFPVSKGHSTFIFRKVQSRNVISKQTWILQV
jgi:hypothetical protein